MPSDECYVLGVVIKAMSRHDITHQQAINRTNNWSFPEGADYPTCVVSILAGRIV